MFRKRNTHIHFVGIGGIGMSGIAEVLLNLGYRVTGSDLRDNETTRRLQGLGATIFQGHKADQVGEADVVVISSAVPAHNPEVATAHQERIPVIPRAEMLAELTRLKDGVLIAGSHGKTTTTSMIAHTLHHAGLDPTVVIGGKVNAFESNARLGYGSLMVAEADESDGSFLCLPPTHAVITNIDEEHLDHYGTKASLLEAFVGFANRVPFYGATVLCIDDPNIQSIHPKIGKRTITYGQSEQADYRVSEIRNQGTNTHFRLHTRGENRGEFSLNMPGLHNVLNAVATIAIADLQEVHVERIREALASFSGVQRRFTIRSQSRGITVVDDYGHHPTEICATLEGARSAYPKARLVVAMQPHRYTRLRDNFEDFARSFKLADRVLISDVYPAGEKPIEGYSSQSLVQAIKENGRIDSVEYSGDLDQLFEKLRSEIEEGDVVLTLGAGSITQVSHRLAEALSSQ